MDCALASKAALPRPSTLDPRPSSQSGFTLAGLIVIMTIMMIFVAYTVPKQWSKIMQRERDAQTIFTMKQYARAIERFQAKHGSYPVSLNQIREARSPRLIRGVGPLLDPLTGQDDWILIPATAQQGTPANPPGVPPRPSGPTPSPWLAAPGPGRPSQPAAGQQAPRGSPGGFSGPIAGVRPNKTGQSFLSLNGAETYEEWTYTVEDLRGEIQRRRQALLTK